MLYAQQNVKIVHKAAVKDYLADLEIDSDFENDVKATYITENEDEDDFKEMIYPGAKFVPALALFGVGGMAIVLGPSFALKITFERPCVNGKELPREAKWITPTGCKCTYRYGGMRFAPAHLGEWFEAITKQSARFLYKPKYCKHIALQYGNVANIENLEKQPKY